MVGLAIYGQPRCSCGHQIDVSALAIREVPAADLHRVVKLVGGRMPDPSSRVKDWPRTRSSVTTTCTRGR